MAFRALYLPAGLHVSCALGPNMQHSCSETRTDFRTQTDGLSGIFWLYLNYGKYTSSKKKMFLTLANLFVFSVGAVIVRTPIH